MTIAAKEAGATVLGRHMHYFGEESGVTGVVILAESHISVHTWPEHNYAAFDVFVCGEADPKLAIAALKRLLKPKNIIQKAFRRGRAHQ